MTSPPRSLAVPMMTSALTLPATSAMARAHAAGTYSESRGSSDTCSVLTPYEDRIPAPADPLEPIATASSGLPIARARRPAIVSTSSDSMVGAPAACSIKARTMFRATGGAARARPPACPRHHPPEDLDGVADLHRQL